MRWHSEQIGGAGGGRRQGWGKGAGKAGCEEPTVGRALSKVTSNKPSHPVLPAPPWTCLFHLKGWWGRFGGLAVTAERQCQGGEGSTLPGEEMKQTLLCKLPTVHLPRPRPAKTVRRAASLFR